MTRRTWAAVLAAAVLAAAGGRADDEPKYVFPAGSVRTAAAKREAANNLKMIGLALHNYHDAYGHLPIGFYAADGQKLGLGWRVAILPYLEQEALYKQFKLDEPWDSDHNKKLVAQMPKAFGVQGGDVPEGKTYLRTFFGKDTINPPPAAGAGGQPAKGGRFAGITDGTSNTLLVVEAAEPVFWTRPDGLAYDADKPVPKLGGVFAGGFTALLADGSTRFLPRTIDEKTLRAAITARGGEVFQFPE